MSDSKTSLDFFRDFRATHLWRHLVFYFYVSASFSTLVPFQCEASSESPESQFAAGMKLYETGQLKQAEPLMKKIMELRPERPAMEAKYAYLLNDLQKFDESITIFKHALELDPAMFEAQRRLGDAYLSTGQFSLAEMQYQKFVEKNPNDIDAWNNLSVSLSQQGKLPGAKHAAVMAIRIDQNAHSGWDNLGGAEFLLGDIPAARKAYEQALYVDPKRADAQKIRDVLAGLKDLAASKDDISDNYEALERKNPFRWPTDRAITVCVMSAKDVPHYSSKFADMLKESFNQWSVASAGKLKFSFIPDPVLADILVRFSADPKQWVKANEKGHCDTFMKKGVAEKASITLLTVSNNDNIPLSDDDAHRTALHEIGHALGIEAHSNNRDDIMYSFVEPKLPTTLSSRDKKTIQLMYP